ncbi:flagellar hook-length control protein FliK [Halomonas sp. 7T]|uniref:flagellar hook-length control protein FliK n=1 Tax=Halomonas sp. 7T TaxID=2893469 RepID=UPI0021D9B712|nr:flagellar hook-length control protein FliK [Halomonas sp. 7T]UXZ53816.1 flagellar hook-length control protein FliK [Halomonas sp. 7T]
MNIQLLLSANQSQSALPSAPAQMLGAKGTPQALFQQALTQASSTQLQRLTSTPADVTAPEPLTRFAELLASLDIELNEEALADLLAQLQGAGSDTLPTIALEGALGEGDAPALTPLDEIAARLSLVDAFSGTATPPPGLEAAPQVQNIAQQLAISERQATELLASFNALRAAAPESTVLANIHRQVASLLPSANIPENNPSLTRALPVNGQQPSINLTSDFDSQQLAAFSHSAMAPPVDANASPLRIGSEMSSIALAELAQGASRGGEPSFFSPSGTLTPATGSLMSSASIATPVSSPAWPSQLGQQLIQFAQRGGEHEVKMQLHPAELGPLSISLKVSEHGTQAHFLSAHAQVRQVLEQAIPQLREALAEQGISLGETSVGEHNNPNDQAFAQQGSGNPSGVGNSGSQEEGDGVLTPSENNNPLVLDGRVDLYA